MALRGQQDVLLNLRIILSLGGRSGTIELKNDVEQASSNVTKLRLFDGKSLRQKRRRGAPAWPSLTPRALATRPACTKGKTYSLNLRLMQIKDEDVLPSGQDAAFGNVHTFQAIRLLVTIFAQPIGRAYNSVSKY